MKREVSKAARGEQLIWSEGTSEAKRAMVHLALMAHLALESASDTFGADGASGTSGAETRIWYIWRRDTHLVHLALEGASGTSVIGRIQVKVEIC
ncbi:hypothetical protein DY000_02033757 [Brassica cretica]|uniref:Uncharacterized protein n=1 Tax=Brassica cretica TaxID=69181 RepID=A0ABQ7DHG2_BRACR|nr:hypothetical protein DY000_02033757 [Brassica cretica]